MVSYIFYITTRPPSKLAYAEGFEGDASPRTAAYSNSVTDSSTASLSKSPTEVEFRRRSTIKIAAVRLLVRSRWKRRHGNP